MLAGAIRHFARYEMKVALTATQSQSGVDPPGGQAIATVRTRTAPDPDTFDDGMLIEIHAKKAGSGMISVDETEYKFWIPALSDFPLDTYTKSGFDTSTDAYVVLFGVHVYRVVGYWWVVVDSMEYYADGSRRTTAFDGGFTIIGGNLQPAGMPLIGVPPRVGAGAALDPAPLLVGGACDTSISAAFTAQADGGWRIRETDGGSWVTFPVSESIQAPPTVGGCGVASVPAQPSISVSNTYDARATAEASFNCTSAGAYNYDCYECSDGSTATVPTTYELTPYEKEYVQKSSEIGTYPDLAKGITRMLASPLYGALWYRAGLPEVRKTATATCCKLFGSGGGALDCSDPPGDCPDPAQTVTQSTQLFPEFAETWNRVRNTAHTIEDPFTYTTYTPWSYDIEYWLVHDVDAVVISPGTCPPETEAACCFNTERWFELYNASGTYPSTQVRSGVGGNPDILAALDHSDHEARYCNTAANPHWSYALFSPPDSNEDYWKVNGTKENFADYWGILKQQHFSGPWLTGGEDSGQRNNVITEPWLEGQLYGEYLSRFGFPACPIGINRFDVEVVTPTSKALTSASSPAWTFENCTAAFGASNITLTPTGGATSIAAEYDIGRFTEAPFMLPHIADRITVGWGGAPITAVTVKLINQAGKATTLATTAGTHARPLVVDDNYAGTWAQDYLAGDFGVDIPAGGLSLASMHVPELIHALSLLRGRGASKLRFELTLSASSACTLDYPTFLPSASNGTVVHETSQAASLIWPSGPGVRFGQWNVWDDTVEPQELRDEPVVREPGEGPSTVLDAMAWRNLVLEGVGLSTNLTADLQALYDSREFAVLENAADGTLSLLLTGDHSGRLLYVNSLREIPPLNSLPRLARSDTDDWMEAGATYVQKSYSACQEYMRYVSAVEVFHVEQPGSPRTRWTAAAGASPTDWAITEHNHAVDNNEGATFFGVLDAPAPEGDFAYLSPWHGYHAVISAPAAATGPPAYDVSRALRHSRAYIQDPDDLVFGVANNLLPKGWNDRVLGDAVEEVAIRYDPGDKRNGLMVLEHAANNISMFTIYDELWEELSPGFIIVSGASIAHPRLEIAEDRRHFLAWRDGSNIKMQIRNGLEALIQSTFTVISGVDSDSFSIREYVTARGEWRLGILYVVSGDITYAESSDGINFGTPRTIAVGSFADPALEIISDKRNAADARKCFYFRDGTNIRVVIEDGNENVIKTSTVVVSNSAAEAFAVRAFTEAQGELRVGLLYLATGGVLTYLTSRDGFTFA